MGTDNSQSVEKKKPEKRGNIGRAEDGSPLLVNRDNQAYKVSEAVLYVWYMCDGSRSLEELTQSVVKEAEGDQDRIREQLLDLARSLEKVGLLEFV